MRTSDLRAGIDTSVLVRLLTGVPKPLAGRAIEYVAETQSREERLGVSDLVIAEAYFACQHHYGMDKAAVLKGLAALLREPVFAVPPAVVELLQMRGIAKAKPGFVDRLIRLDYGKFGVGMVTFEKSAGKLEKVTVLTAGE